MNHNQFPGIGQNSTETDIQKAFRAAAMEIHPDHNNAPEAAIDFARLREARDRLIEEARRNETARDAVGIQSATDGAIKATIGAVYGGAQYATASADEPTPEEVAHIQALDELALRYARKSRFSRGGEPSDVRRHRRKIETTNRRIDGKY